MKKFLSVFLCVLTVCTTMCMGAFNASAATTGATDSNTYCTVTISQDLLRTKGRQYATVKLNTGTLWNIWNTNRKIKITLRDQYGRYICSWYGKGGDVLSLGDDHSVYRIYVDCAETSFTGVGNCAKWKVTSPKKCTIK